MAERQEAFDWVYMDVANETEVRVGELISAEAGGMPIYRVMSIDYDRAWLRDLTNGSDRLTPLRAFHWKALPAGRRQ